MTDKSTKIFDLFIFGRSKEELLKELEHQLLHSRSTTYIFTPNPEQVVRAEGDEGYKELLQSADILIPDGQGLVWASRRLSRLLAQPPLQERIAGVDLAQDLLRLAKYLNLKVLLIGGEGYAIDSEKYPLLTWIPGYADVSQPTPEEETHVGQVIMEYQPDIIFVAFGAPYQEVWAGTHREFLDANKVKLVMVVGGAFDFIFGKVSRAPRLVQKLGVEWLYRLVVQPWRWKRQLSIPVFIYLTYKKALGF